jgi:hypothetical protein
MATRFYRVYAICSTGHELRLEQMAEGTRGACARFIRMRVRMRLPTHFLFVSSMDIDAASRRYLP